MAPEAAGPGPAALPDRAAERVRTPTAAEEDRPVAGPPAGLPVARWPAAAQGFPACSARERQEARHRARPASAAYRLGWAATTARQAMPNTDRSGRTVPGSGRHW